MHAWFQAFKRLSIITGLLLLAACSSTHAPKQVYLDPQPVSSGNLQPASGITVKLVVNDLRKQHFLIAIHKDGEEKLDLIASANNVRQSIEKAIRQSLEARNITVTDSAHDTLTVEIIDLSCNAQQHMADYSAITQVTLKATFKTDRRTIVRQYTASRRNTGSFSVDVSQQQNQLNQTLNAVLTGLLTDNRLLSKD
ncbi:YajG family lipoprotein [Celerinatantimonas sp. YJH-8]|uniref:YajG family lipoprotein n=1 Tax=Celerinatantimonas sp. YJH-8 TaxID=3228714 RepID=UPI0038C9E0DA